MAAYKLSGVIEGEQIPALVYPTIQKAKIGASRVLFQHNLIAHVERWIENEPEPTCYTLESKKVPVRLTIEKVESDAH